MQSYKKNAHIYFFAINKPFSKIFVAPFILELKILVKSLNLNAINKKGKHIY